MVYLSNLQDVFFKLSSSLAKDQANLAELALFSETPPTHQGNSNKHDWVFSSIAMFSLV